MPKETELDKAVTALERADGLLKLGHVVAAHNEVQAALAHLGAHDIWLQELLTTKTIEDAAVKHPKE